MRAGACRRMAALGTDPTTWWTRRPHELVGWRKTKPRRVALPAGLAEGAAGGAWRWAQRARRSLAAATSLAGLLERPPRQPARPQFWRVFGLSSLGSRARSRARRSSTSRPPVLGQIAGPGAEAWETCGGVRPAVGRPKGSRPLPVSSKTPSRRCHRATTPSRRPEAAATRGWPDGGSDRAGRAVAEDLERQVAALAVGQGEDRHLAGYAVDGMTDPGLATRRRRVLQGDEAEIHLRTLPSSPRRGESPYGR